MNGYESAYLSELPGGTKSNQATGEEMIYYRNNLQEEEHYNP